jgi:hypothetical protein
MLLVKKLFWQKISSHILINGLFTTKRIIMEMVGVIGDMLYDPTFSAKNVGEKFDKPTDTV